VAPESRTQGPREFEWVMPTINVPVCVVCAIKAVQPEFWQSSYHLRNSLKEEEKAIDEVREITLKEGEKSQENSLRLQPPPQQIANIKVWKKWITKEM